MLLLQNTGYGNTGHSNGPAHSTVAGSAIDPRDHTTGINSGNTHTGTGYNNNHTVRPGSFPSFCSCPYPYSSLQVTGTGTGTGHHTGTHHHPNDIATNSSLGNNIGPGPHHTAAADVPAASADPLYHGGVGTGSTGTAAGRHTGTTGTGIHNTTGSHTTGTTGAHTTGTGAHTSGGTPSGVKSKEIVGKVEIAVGKALHSNSLLVKGETKLEQAQSIRAQHSELTEAERLEQEAKLARDRAGQHGAAAHGHAGAGGGLTQPGVAGPGGPVGLDGGFGHGTAHNAL